MKVTHRIVAIERRAARVKLTLAELCRAAGVSYSTVWRWRTGRVSPTERVSERHLAKLDAQLRARQAELRKTLGGIAA